MFDFVSAIFTKTVTVIIGFFVAIGTMASGVAPTQDVTPPSVTTETVATTAQGLSDSNLPNLPFSNPAQNVPTTFPQESAGTIVTNPQNPPSPALSVSIDQTLGELLDRLRAAKPGYIERPTPEGTVCIEGTNVSEETFDKFIEDKLDGKDVSLSAVGLWFGIKTDGKDSIQKIEVNFLTTESSDYWQRTESNGVLIFSLDKLLDGKLVVKGKGYGIIYLEIRGEGNKCAVTGPISIPFTTDTVITLPIKKTTEVGPISYDLDGNGVSDLNISLKYQLSVEQEGLLSQILDAVNFPD